MPQPRKQLRKGNLEFIIGRREKAAKAVQRLIETIEDPIKKQEAIAFIEARAKEKDGYIYLNSAERKRFGVKCKPFCRVKGDPIPDEVLIAWGESLINKVFTPPNWRKDLTEAPENKIENKYHRVKKYWLAPMRRGIYIQYIDGPWKYLKYYKPDGI